MRLALVSAIMIVLGLGLGLIASIALPHIYAAETTIRYNLGETSATSDNADRTLTTQTVLITGREVLQPVADSTGVPIDYLTENTTAAVVPNSEIIDVQVKHPDRASGIQLADAIAKRYLEVANGTGNRNQLQAQLDNAQRQLSNPTTTPAGQLDLAGQVDDLQNQLAASANTSNIAAIVAPAYSVTAAVFPDTLITLGIGALVGAVAAGAIGYRMFRNWTRG
jgi:capsular polysaccharide biosynthesis protein